MKTTERKFKVTIRNRIVYYATLTEANRVAEQIRKATGIIIGIEAA